MPQQPTSLPVYEQRKFYKELHRLEDWRDAHIYLGNHSPNYYLRLRSVQGYITKSLRTPNLTKARVKANELIPTLIQKLNRGLPTRTHNVLSMFEWYLQTPYAEMISAARERQIRRTGEIYAQYFGNKNIERIKLSDWRGWWSFRWDYYVGTKWAKHTRSKDGTPAYKTLKMERDIWQMVTSRAVENGLCSYAQEMPPVPARQLGYTSNRARPDATFTPAQYAKFRIGLNEYRDRLNTRGKNHQYFGEAFLCYIWLLRHSGARAYEILNLRHRDCELIEIKKDDGTKVLTYALYITATKTKHFYKRTSVLTYTGTECLKRFLNIKSEKFSRQLGTNQNNYVFQLWRDKNKHLNADQLGTMFRRLCKEMDLYVVGDESYRTHITLRALRRYYITRMLDAGVSIEQVAANCGNTPGTIRRFYDAVQTTRYAASIYQGSYSPDLLAAD
jgi:hypothetical protein